MLRNYFLFVYAITALAAFVGACIGINAAICGNKDAQTVCYIVLFALWECSIVGAVIVCPTLNSCL